MISNAASSYRKLVDNVIGDRDDDIDEKVEVIRRIAIFLVCLEYSCVGIFLYLGRLGYAHLALAGQFFFFSVALIIDWETYKQIGSPFKDMKTRFGVPKAPFLLVSLAPNYIHVISTAVAAGSTQTLWHDPRFAGAKENFQRNWAYVPLVGDTIGQRGLPAILEDLVIFSCIMHGLAILLFWCLGDDSTLAEICDAANLQFIGKALRSIEDDRFNLADKGNFTLTRLFAAFFLKYPMLWAKTSLLASLYDQMDESMLQSTFLALALAWYGILQLLPNFIWMVTQLENGIAHAIVDTPLFFLVLGLLQQAAHLVGVFECPSHDFSVLLRGCTAAP